MVKLGNPVLKREIRLKTPASKLIIAISIRFACLGIIYILIDFSRLGSGLLAFALSETLIILLFTPASILESFASKTAKRDNLELSLTSLKPHSVITGKFVKAVFYNFVFIVISALFMFILPLFYRGLSFWRIASANLAILGILFTISAFTLSLTLIFRRKILLSTLVSYFLIVIMLTSVVSFGFVIESLESNIIKNRLTGLAMHINPFIMVSRTLGTIDIMRTRYIYELADPIVTRGFSYPKWYSIVLIYLISSFILLIPSLIIYHHNYFYSSCCKINNTDLVD
ncbi:hypothetical protein GF312_06880 [Candidatus Poribacteria bacterium]|nr:hypothetical protein [Candidatus Poribacteria bacterium]